jgi:hypothetical protein
MRCDMPQTVLEPKVVQTTVRLPETLYLELKDLLDQGLLEGASINDVVIHALRNAVQAAQEKRIDDQFAGMATDEKYLEQSRILSEEFANADWESLPKERGKRAKR